MSAQRLEEAISDIEWLFEMVIPDEAKRALRSRVMAILETRWRPIHSAPRQANPVKYLLLSNGHHVGVGYYHEDDYDEDAPSWRDESGEFIEPAPTHWQPLPDPPNDANAIQGQN